MALSDGAEDDSKHVTVDASGLAALTPLALPVLQISLPVAVSIFQKPRWIC
jgi:hypothetical protein